MDKSKNITEAIILAGGLGTRLRAVIGEYPKPLALTGGVPFLKILMNYLADNGITRIILAVGYKWEMIQAQFGANYRGMTLIYSIEKEPLGTGGAIKLALDKSIGQAIFVLNGDTLFNIPLQVLAAEHIDREAKCSIALCQIKENTRYGTVEINSQNQIIKFTEKGETTAGLINGGIYVLNKNSYQLFPTEESFSFETEFLTKNLEKTNLIGIPFDSYFKDIGIPEDYYQFEKDLENSEIKKLR